MVPALGVPRSLRDRGQRSFVRLEPSIAHRARISLVGSSGWRFSDRALRDISAGGASFWVNCWESRRVRVGEVARLDLKLGDAPLTLSGRCVHMSGASKWWSRRIVGIAFQFDHRYERGFSGLVDYLLRLQLDQSRAQGARTAVTK